MKTAAMLALPLAFMLAGPVQAQIDSAPPLPFDTPVNMRAVEAVCTGIGSDAREDPRWAAYPLRIELAGRAGQYLGEAQVTLSKGTEAIVRVQCGGPWLLLRVPAGAYDVTAEVGGVSKGAKVSVSGRGQARVVIRFPDQGGATSPEYVPKS